MDNGEEVEVTMMYKDKIKENGVAYYKDNNITVLTMDLKDYYEIQFEFMAIMPNENLNGYVENITKEQINEIDKNLKLSSDEHYGINISIPKFYFSYNLKLKQDLNKLGIKEAFSENSANFSKMARLEEMDRCLFVSNALHKAEIKFNEDGIKEDAEPIFIHMTTTRTTATSWPSSSPINENNPINIIINQPFMFIIRDKITKDIWFTGTVYEPNLWKNDKKNYSH